MITSTLTVRPLGRNFRGRLLAAFCALAVTVASLAADAPRKNYNLPAADAVKALKSFSEQSGEQIVYPVEQVRGVQTNAVSGEFTPRAALDKMLAGTGLVAVEDEKTGALSVRRDPALEKNADSRRTAELRPAIKLETYTVLGTRIRQTDADGPSPVSVYDAEYIRATGAMTLADFMNYLPQNYTGIASGRASAPNEFNPEFGQRTESTTALFNFVTGSSSAPPGQTGVSGVSLRGLGSGSTLVLVDGRRVAQSGAGNRSTDTHQGFVDLDAIPLGMIDQGSEVHDRRRLRHLRRGCGGGRHQHRPQEELHRHGAQRQHSHGFRARRWPGAQMRHPEPGFLACGKWTGSISLEYFDRQNLKGAQRDFSANDQDHSAIPTGTITATGAIRYGVPRLLGSHYGYPAVIQASGASVSWATSMPFPASAW